MAKALTALSIESVRKKALESGKRQTVFDGRTPGLCVRATAKGHLSFSVVSRDPAGRQVWAEVRDGNAPVTTLARARELAPAGVLRIKNGQPAFPRIEPAETQPTYNETVARFIEQYARPRQRTWKETERILNSVPYGKRPFASIAKRDVIKHLDALVAAGKEPTARVTLAWTKTLWRWAWRKDEVEHPQMDSLKAEDFGIVREARCRVYTDDELKSLWNATGLTRHEHAYVKLLALLAVRRGALRMMRKNELDSTTSPTTWTIPPDRVKQKKSAEGKGRVYVVPIPPLARRVLLPLLKGDGDLVFPSFRKGVAMEVGTPLMKKVRKGSGISDWTPHAHRHTLATWLQNEGHDEYDRALVLQHAGAGTVTSGYSHGYSFERARALLEKWASHVEGVVAPAGAELLA